MSTDVVNTRGVNHEYRQSRAATNSVSQTDRRVDMEEYSDKGAQYTNAARLDACVANA